MIKFAKWLFRFATKLIVGIYFLAVVFALFFNFFTRVEIGWVGWVIIGAIGAVLLVCGIEGWRQEREWDRQRDS